MIVRNAVFFNSFKEPAKYNSTELPEIAIAGKSNVGKSSLINFLANNSKLAYTSKKPGKTRLINFFLLNGSFYLADLPGYGFSRVAQGEKSEWQGMVEGYLKKSTQLRGILLLLDIRHDPSADDRQMIEWAQYYHIPCAVIATKSDKLAKSKRRNALAHLAKELDMEGPMAAVSVRCRFGKEELLGILEKLLQ